MAAYTKTPLVVKARETTVCHETGKTIKKGKDCWLNRATKHIFAMDSQKAKEFRQHPNGIFPNDKLEAVIETSAPDEKPRVAAPVIRDDFDSKAATILAG